MLLDQLPCAAVPLEHDDHSAASAEKTLGDLDQQARAVAALAVGVETAAMRQPGKGLHPEPDRCVAALGRRDKAHAAGRAGLREVPGPGKA